MNITVFQANGNTISMQIEYHDLGAMQRIVGGLIEAAYPAYPLDGIVIIVDEEGLLKNKPSNRALTKLYGSPIVGDGFIITRADWEKDT